MKNIFGSALLACLVLLITGCNPPLRGGRGTGSGGGNAQMASGNWDIVATSGAISLLGFGGTLTVTGSSVSGHMLVYSNDNCFPLTTSESTQAVNGTIDTTGSLPLTITSGGTTFTINLTVPTGTSSAATAVTGTYSASGGCENGISGNLTGELVSGTVGGTWVATVGSSTLSLNFATSSTPISSGNLQGAYAITPGAFTFTGPVGCTVSGVTLNTSDSFTAGREIFLDITDVENSTAGNIVISGTVDDVTAPTAIVGTYDYVSGGNCLLNTSGGSITFSKQ